MGGKNLTNHKIIRCLFKTQEFGRVLRRNEPEREAGMEVVRAQPLWDDAYDVFEVIECGRVTMARVSSSICSWTFHTLFHLYDQEECLHLHTLHPGSSVSMQNDIHVGLHLLAFCSAPTSSPSCPSSYFFFLNLPPPFSKLLCFISILINWIPLFKIHIFVMSSNTFTISGST